MRKQLSITSLSSIFLGRPCGNVMMACLPSSARRMSLIILTATQDAETYEGTSESDNSSRWINANAFYAILHGLGAGMFPSLCSWTMRDAFGQTPLTDHAALDCHLSAAAQWIIYAGQAIFHVILVPKENEFTPGGNPLWNLDTWHRWKAGFLQGAGNAALRQRSRALSARAAGIMDALESNMANS